MPEGNLRLFLEWLGLIAPPFQPRPVAASVTSAAPAVPVATLASTPPWSGVLPAPALDGGLIRAAILRDLLAQLDELGPPTSPEEQADARFLSGLVRCLGSETLELPVFPDVSLRLDRLLRRADPPREEVIELVSSDPDLLRRVWSAAHSAMFARGVADIDHAIARIGFDRLWRIGMAVCVNSPVFRAGRFQGRVEQIRARGSVAGRVAAWLADDPRGDAFLAGMLYGAGGLYIWRSAAATGRVHPGKDRIQRVLRDHTAGFSVLMARAWGFGEEVAAGVGFWPQPDRAPAGHTDFVRLVHVAVVATLAAEEARAGRDCGGLAVLRNYDGVYCAAETTLARASRAWRGETDGAGGDTAAQTA
jgi:HD-like signal output (HDOD) protein